MTRQVPMRIRQSLFEPTILREPGGLGSAAWALMTARMRSKSPEGNRRRSRSAARSVRTSCIRGVFGEEIVEPPEFERLPSHLLKDLQVLHILQPLQHLPGWLNFGKDS